MTKKKTVKKKRQVARQRRENNDSERFMFRQKAIEKRRKDACGVFLVPSDREYSAKEMGETLLAIAENMSYAENGQYSYSSVAKIAAVLMAIVGGHSVRVQARLQQALLRECNPEASGQQIREMLASILEDKKQEIVKSLVDYFEISLTGSLESCIDMNRPKGTKKQKTGRNYKVTPIIGEYGVN